MKLLVAIFVSALAISSSFAYDPSPLQDICVAINDPKSAVFVNGKFCKNPDDVTADDFLFQGLNIPRDTNNKLGSNVTAVFVDQIAGLNTLGIAVARVDFGPYGLNPPHLHPRASEILTVMEGELYAGFVTSNQLGNKLFAKVLKPGDAIVFPIGLIHFQLNVGKTKAVAMVSFGSQSPGITTIGNDLFGSKPPINPEVLTKAFQLDKKVIHYLQSQFWLDNSS